MLERIDEDEKLDDVFGQRRTGGLYYEHILLAYIAADWVPEREGLETRVSRDALAKETPREY